jgi:hypothetical protein
MASETQTTTPNEVHELVAEALRNTGEPTEVQSDGIRLSRWPAARITVDYANVFQTVAGAWTAWVDLTWMYETDLPNTAAKAHVIGLGSGRAEALADAVASWTMGAVPALISYVEGTLKPDADSWSANDPRTVPGWSCICGPYVLRGDAGSREPLGEFLRQNAMLAEVRGHLASVLDSNALFHTVSLYRAQTSSGPLADVLIDNQPLTAAGERLKGAIWPDRFAHSDFLSVRHFLLLIRDTSTPATCQRRHAAHGADAGSPPGPRLAIPLFLILATMFSFALYEGFARYAEAIAPAAGGAAFTLTPPASLWLVPASVLGILFAAALLLVVTLQDDRPGAHSFECVPWRLVAGGCVIAAFMGVLAYFATHSYLQLTADGIALRRLWSFQPERYAYSRVIALREVGKPGDRGATFSIKLRDAPTWSTRQEVIFPGSAEKQYLAERTGLKIEKEPAP